MRLQWALNPMMSVFTERKAGGRQRPEGDNRGQGGRQKSEGGNQGFPGGSVVKNLPVNAGDVGEADLIPSLGRSPGVGNGNPLQYSCPENPMDRGA